MIARVFGRVLYYSPAPGTLHPVPDFTVHPPKATLNFLRPTTF